MRPAVIILTRPGRELCPECRGDIGAACLECGGTGTLPFRPRCVDTCGERLIRYGWHTPHRLGERTVPERLPLFFCPRGHLVAMRLTAVPTSADESRPSMGGTAA